MHLLAQVCRRRVIVIGLCVCVCVCVWVTANVCNDLLFKIIGKFVWKCTLVLVRDSSNLWDNSSMAEIRQSKVSKTLILSTCHICSVAPITSAQVHVLDHMLVCNIHAFVVKLPCNISPLRLMISLEQWRSNIGCFFPVVCFELNIKC